MTEYVICSICGQKCSLCYGEETNSAMKNNKFCFGCNFWNDIYKEKEDHVFVEGGSYLIKEDIKHGMKGFGGREFKIKKFGSDKVIVTHNLWYQGEIPKEFKDKLPDTAEFIDKK